MYGIAALFLNRWIENTFHLWNHLAEFEIQLNDLKLFALATRSELDRLPTTLQDDEIILDALFVVRDEEDSGSSSGDMISSTKAKEQQQSIDTIASVEYRMAFKRALGTALRYAEAEITSMMVGKDEL